MPLSGDRLRLLRQKHGYTQEALAERLNLGIRQIHRYEKGLSDPAGNIVAKIARELGVSADYLLGLSDQPDGVGHESHLTSTESALLDAVRRKDERQVLQILNSEFDLHFVTMAGAHPARSSGDEGGDGKEPPDSRTKPRQKRLNKS